MDERNSGRDSPGNAGFKRTFLFAVMADASGGARGGNLCHEIYGLAAISLWEVAKKVRLEKLLLPKDLPGWFADALAPNIEVLPMTAQVVTDAMRLPEFPNRDPAGELIVASARVHKLILVTTDAKLKDYHHARVHYFKPALRAKRT